jgi:hypothetical protein
MRPDRRLSNNRLDDVMFIAIKDLHNVTIHTQRPIQDEPKHVCAGLKNFVFYFDGFIHRQDSPLRPFVGSRTNGE